MAPEAVAVPSTVISNFVAEFGDTPVTEPLANLVSTGRLDDRKNPVSCSRCCGSLPTPGTT